MNVHTKRMIAAASPPSGFLPDVRAEAERPVPSLATAEAGSAQRRFAFLLCGLIGVATAATLPWAREPFPFTPGFLAIDESALVLVYGLTTWLFFTQYRRTLSVPILALGAGSLYTTLVVFLQLLSFPDLMTGGLLIGKGAPSLAWLWNFWHVAPPVAALAYALLPRTGSLAHITKDRAARVAWMTLAGVCVVWAVTAACVVWFPHILPRTTDPGGGYQLLTTSGVGPVIILVNVTAIAVLWRATRLRTVLELWLGAALMLLLFDNIVTDLGAARNSVGWVVGRIEAVMAGLIILGVYLYEFDFLYRSAEAAFAEGEIARKAAMLGRDQLEVALTASGMAEWSLDLTRDLFRATRLFNGMFGRPDDAPAWGSEDFLARVVENDRPAARAALRAAEKTGALAFEGRIRRMDDNAERWIEVIGRAHADAQGRAVALDGCMSDTTERRQIQERLRQSERLEAIGQLTGGVAHDFNNLLTAILGSLDMIVQDPGDAEKVARLARIALDAARRGTDLTEKLLSFSRRQLLTPQVVNLNRLINEFMPLLDGAVGEAIPIRLALDPLLEPARLDPNQFQATLLNLAANARDAMPNGGRLTIKTQMFHPTASDLAAIPGLAAEPCLLVSVADTGIGMDEATLHRVFEPFFTTKEIGKGTGLGLSQVYGFIRQAGGQCRIRTAHDEGCIVELFLPRSQQAVSMKPPAVVPLRKASNNEVVLLVEDEDAVREIAAESLEVLGYEVQEAINARMALEILRGSSRIDLLFSDVVMPGGMNGAQLAVEARRIRPGLKVLLTSGYTVTATGGTHELPPEVPLLRKPYVREDLAAKLSAVLGTSVPA
ncbi:MAG TPA: MASE4 domain-containing protein [Alphaproteobacteria bacterium]|nr:MASE4 domain-containing protein [Alphaproteobacteria bacterium]